MPEITNQHKDVERRTYVVDPFAVVTRDDGGGVESKRIVGHAAVFNQVAGPEWFRERIQPGAFAQTIKNDDIRALFNHDPNLVLGRNAAGTLSLKEDDNGLYMEIEPPDTTIANDVLASIVRGDVTQASFAFRTLDDAWETNDGEEVRILKRVQLFDVSPVTFPFYENTDVALRSMEERLKSQKDLMRNKNMNLRKRRLELLRIT
jgi:HK97 family phage prohead protease